MLFTVRIKTTAVRNVKVHRTVINLYILPLYGFAIVVVGLESEISFMHFMRLCIVYLLSSDLLSLFEFMLACKCSYSIQFIQLRLERE